MIFGILPFKAGFFFGNLFFLCTNWNNMIYLILGILSSTLIYIIFKYIDKFKISTFDIIIINYITASILGILLSDFNQINFSVLKFMLRVLIVLTLQSIPSKISYSFAAWGKAIQVLMCGMLIISECQYNRKIFQNSTFIFFVAEIEIFNFF